MKPTPPNLRHWVLLGVLCTAGLTVSGAAQPKAPLLRGLGEHHSAITTSFEKAQRYFNQGLVLMYGFNHAEAIRSFKSAAQLDPNCAMAWWGVAYCEGPNINAPMMPDAYPRAWSALKKAIALKNKVSKREQDYIDALAVRYTEDAPEDRSELDTAFADAMRELANQYPDDLDAQAVFCESIMNLMPWDYWSPAKQPKDLTHELLATLQNILRRDPNHPGANHFFIHAIESGPTPEAGIPSADRLASIAPAAGHLVHMPSHIYVRVGQYDEAAEANVRASRADENYLAQCKQQGLYPAGYYPHNVHFLWYANSLRGNSREAIKAAKKVSDFALDARCGAVEGPRLRYLHILALAQFGKWDKVLKAPKPIDDYPFDQGMYHYARSLAHLANKGLPKAKQEYALFNNVLTADATAEVTSDYFPADKVVLVANHLLKGKIALYQGDEDTAIREMAQAVEQEDEIAYMEPPFWYYSARWSLGATLLRTGNYKEAEQVFRRDLAWLPRNGWALNGLAGALRNQGKTAAADQVWREFQSAWQSADVELDLDWY